MSRQQTVWIDIDNPPQVQYLVPIVLELRRRGFRVLITARDYGVTHQLLRDRGVDFIPVGRQFSRHKWHKVAGTLQRALDLLRVLKYPRPNALIAAGRASSLTAWLLHIPRFIICDYEHAEITSYARLGCHLLLPSVIGHETCIAKGFRERQLHDFPGIKEDLTFYQLDLEQHPAWTSPDHNPENPLVVYRPPAAESHYYSGASATISSELLQYLAAQPGITLLFLPRYDWQKKEVKSLDWRGQLVIPETPIPFVSLFKSADLVISSGGTMLREAAVMGVPAYSIFQSQMGGVDLFLEQQGYLTRIEAPSDFSRIRLLRRNSQRGYQHNPETMPTLISTIKQVAGLTEPEVHHDHP